MLDDAGAIDDLTRAEPGRPAAWLSRLPDYLKRIYSMDRKPVPKVAGLVPQLAPRLVADGTPVDPGVAGHWETWRADLDLLDSCLANGVPVIAPPEGAQISLALWLRLGSARDLSAVAADPAYQPLLRTCVSDYLARGHGRLDELTGLPALHSMARDAIDGWLAEIPTGGLLTASEALARIDECVRLELPAFIADLPAKVTALDLSAVLARTLRAGVYDEYSWPALDEAARELAGQQGRLELSVSWPVLTVHGRTKAIAVGPEGRVAEHDLRLPAGAQPAAVIYAGEEFLVIHASHSQPWQAYWSSAPTQPFPVDLTWLADTEHGVLAGTGDRLNGSQVLHPGDQTVRPDRPDRPVFADGTGFWTAKGVGAEAALHELDPETGDVGRPALPACFEAALRPGDRLRPGPSWLLPLPSGRAGTPFGQQAGLTGFAVAKAGAKTRITGTDGRSAELLMPDGHPYDSEPSAIITYPGSQDSGVLLGNGRVTLRGSASAAEHWVLEVGHPAPGTPVVPPVPFWSYFESRDRLGSAALRQVSDQTATRLVDAIANVPDDGRALAAAVATVIPELSHVPLRLGVAELARQVLALEQTRHNVLTRKPVAPQPAADSAQPTQPALPSRVDEADVEQGLQGLSKGLARPGWQSAVRPLAELAHVSRLLTGEDDSATGLEAHTGGWLALPYGGAGAAAYRAISPVYPQRVRQGLLALLDAWTRSPFVRPDVEVLVGTAETRTSAVSRDGNGACVLFGESAGRRTLLLAGIRTSKHNPQLPAPIADLDILPPGWTPSQPVAVLADLLHTRGPIARDPAAVDLLATRTGVSQAAAALLMAGLPGIDRGEHNFLDKDVRTILGLKVPEAAAGRDELRALERPALVALYATAMPADLAELWSDGGVVAYAERLAGAFTERFGRRFPVAAETIAAARTLDTALPAAQVLGIVAQPADSELLTRDGQQLDALIADLTALLPWAYAALPAGDPVRAGLPRALELIRQRLDHGDLLVRAGALVAAHDHDHTQAEVEQLLRDSPEADSIVVTYDTWSPDVYFRPARLQQDLAGSLLGRLLAARGMDRTGLPRAVQLLRSPAYTAMADRVRDSGLPAGAYEPDPAASVPQVVADVQARLGLEAGPARLYLQLLTLLEPTDRNVRQWNAWTPAQHKEAVTALVERGLVVEDKRARAGRSAFLPGGWVSARAPNLPLERAKLELYSLVLGDDGVVRGPQRRWLPARPLTELFTEAWQAWQKTQENPA